ncbi:unnamed protein product [Prorocentrum cordatum]|uniref:RanBP2-type domain-containing protein n=1 Tax=Prorocentrum cordatum TaxID=2364126 RepID=A0ABN9UWB1_9DINO|nr:unnamed protein product [Polarella glacialis]
MAPRSKSRDGGWACSGCKARDGAGYDFCWKCWKVRDSAKTTNHGATSTQDDADADDATKAKLKKLRVHLAELRKHAAGPDLAKHVQGNIDIVQKEVDELQAAVDNGSDIPRCFSERKLERVGKLEEEIKEAQDELEKEKALLARQDEKLQKQRARIEELSVPKAGKGWGAAVSFLEQAKKCLREQETDTKIAEALKHAQQQRTVEEVRAAAAAAAAAAKREADAAREAAQDKQQRNKRRTEEEIKQELVSFPQNADQAQITKIMHEAGCTAEQIERHSANPTGTPGRAMRATRYMHKYRAGMAKELQANECSISCVNQRMQKEGWRLGNVPSVRAARGGWRAQLLLATVRPNNMSYVMGPGTRDDTPCESKGGLAKGRMKTVGKEGANAGTAHLWDSEGAPRNSTTAAARAGKYWIQGDDADMDPAGLQHTGVNNKMEWVIVFDTPRGSCATLGEARCRDHFIMGNTYEEHSRKYLNYVGQDGQEGKSHLACAQNNAKGILGNDIIEPLLERDYLAWRAMPNQEGGNVDAMDEQENSDNLDELSYTGCRVEGGSTSLPENTPRRTPAVLGLTASQDCPLVGAKAARERRRPTGRGRRADIDWGRVAITAAWIDAEHIAQRGLRHVDSVTSVDMWETNRMPYARRWGAANKRAHDWASRGRSRERAAQPQALHCEAARADGHRHEGTYFGLIKCFEWVTQRRAWGASQRRGDNSSIMRTDRKMYSIGRHGVLDRGYAEGKAGQRGIEADSWHIPFGRQAVIILELDRLAHQDCRANAPHHVGDRAAATYGRHEHVGEDHPQPIAAVSSRIVTAVDRAVSSGTEAKTVTLASSAAGRDRNNKKTRYLSAGVVKHEKHLGGTATACRRSRVAAINKREPTFAEKKDNGEYDMGDGGYGSRPGAPRAQSTLRGKIHARRQAPQTGTPPMFICTDSQNVNDGVMAGPSWLDKRSHLHLDRWECIAQAVAECKG